MAELATIARPYAEALFRAVPQSEATGWAAQVAALGAVAADPALRQFADSPKVASQQVFDLVAGAVQQALVPGVQNLLRTMIENGRLAALPEVAAQFHARVNASSGVSDAIVYSAYPIEPAALAELAVTLEKRFGRKLAATVQLEPELIGGVRVVVGDEVLDTSVKARLEHMKAALTA